MTVFEEAIRDARISGIDHAQRGIRVTGARLSGDIGRCASAFYGYRNLRLPAKTGRNTILFGSVYSNPWIEVFQSTLNFHFVYNPSENRAWIANLQPLPGEDRSYFSSWSSYSHITYAVLACLPNLGKSGHALLVQGMDGSGTEAAAQMIFNGENLRQILSRVRRPDGSLRSFEVLLRATDIGSHATNPQILSVRLLD